MTTSAPRQTLSLRLATPANMPAISALMNRAIEELQQGYLSPEQIKASHAGMGLDTQLIEDGTYFCVMDADVLVGCGGWYYRATLYGGNHTEGRDARLLDAATEPAKIRAMYTHPDHTRRGIGRLVLDAAEAAARARGFQTAEMAATLAGQPFYERCGYAVEYAFNGAGAESDVPLLKMSKRLT